VFFVEEKLRVIYQPKFFNHSRVEPTFRQKHYVETLQEQ